MQPVVLRKHLVPRQPSQAVPAGSLSYQMHENGSPGMVPLDAEHLNGSLFGFPELIEIELSHS